MLSPPLDMLIRNYNTCHLLCVKLSRTASEGIPWVFIRMTSMPSYAVCYYKWPTFFFPVLPLLLVFYSLYQGGAWCYHCLFLIAGFPQLSRFFTFYFYFLVLLKKCNNHCYSALKWIFHRGYCKPQSKQKQKMTDTKITQAKISKQTK